MRISAVLFLAAGVLCAQEQAPVFRTTTRLVEFTIVALDSHGNAVTDLKKDEVEVTEKGKRREVAFFRFEGSDAAVPPLKPLPAGLFSNRVEFSQGPPRNITAIVLDTLNTAPGDMMWVRAQVVRYLKALPPRTRVAVFHLGGRLAVLHDFTDDADSLRARIEKATLPLPLQAQADIDTMVREAEAIVQAFPMLEEMLRTQIEIDMMANAAVRERRLEGTLAALESLGRHLEGIPGRKNLVWIGGGISMLSITGAMGFGPRSEVKSYEEPVTRSSRRLAQQGIALYVVDSKGLNGPTDMSAMISGTTPVRGRGRFERQQQAEQTSNDMLPAAETMAAITGGRVIRNTNDPSDGMRKAGQDMLGAYSVGFYSGEEPDGKWHGMKVKVKRSGVRLVYRQGFLAESPAAAPAAWTEEEWRSAVYNPLGSGAISIDARCEPMPGKPGQLGLVMQADPRQLHFRKEKDNVVAEIEIAIAEKGPAGELAFHQENGTITVPAAQSTRMGPEQTRYFHSWKPAPGSVTIRLVVRDKFTGRYGTLDVPVSKIPLEAAAAVQSK